MEKKEDNSKQKNNIKDKNVIIENNKKKEKEKNNIIKKDINNDNVNINKIKEVKNKEENNIIKEKENKQINEIHIQKKAPKKNIEIMQNYFDFHLHDVELGQIENHYLSYNKVRPDAINLIKIMLEKYKKFISENLNQTTYPYLTNSIKPQFQVLTNETDKKFFLIQILGEKNSIKRKMFDFFKTLTQVNLYGISPKIKNSFNKDVIESENFKKFSEKLSKWHCHVEVIVLYLEILSTMFNDKFDFKKYNFSLDKNFKNDKDILIKKNFYKLASTLISKVSLNPGLDYQKLLTFALTSLTAGFNLGGLSLLLPQQQLGKVIGIFGLNFLAGKASTQLGSASQFVEFEVLSKLIDKLNISLYRIEKLCFKLIIFEMQEEINTDLETSKVDFIRIKKNEISELLGVYLKGIDYSVEIEKKVNEEYIQLQSCITEEKLDNDWLLEHLSINEFDPNNKDKKKKEKEKKKEMIDDFEII